MRFPIASALILLFSTGHLIAEEKKLAVKYERNGGFAGFHDNISIYADFSYEMATRDEKTVIRGTLSGDHQERLAGLLTHFGEWVKASSDGHDVADGMETRIEIHGTGKVGADGDLRDFSRLMHDVLTAAKDGEKVPKATR